MSKEPTSEVWIHDPYANISYKITSGPESECRKLLQTGLLVGRRLWLKHENGSIELPPCMVEAPKPSVFVQDIEDFVEKVFPSSADEAGEILSTQAARCHLREELYKLKT